MKTQQTTKRLFNSVNKIWSAFLNKSGSLLNDAMWANKSSMTSELNFMKNLVRIFYLEQCLKTEQNIFTEYYSEGKNPTAVIEAQKARQAEIRKTIAAKEKEAADLKQKARILADERKKSDAKLKPETEKMVALLRQLK